MSVRANSREVLLGAAKHALRNSEAIASENPEFRLEFALALIGLKAELLRCGGAEPDVMAIDMALGMKELAPDHMPERFSWTPEQIALLPEPALQSVLRSGCGGLRGNEKEPSAAHWAVEAISKRAVMPPRQMDLFSETAIVSLRKGLRAIASCDPSIVNQADSSGATPLHWAVYLIALECVDDLLELGADPKAKTLSGVEAFDPEAFRKFHVGAPKIPEMTERCEKMQSFLERWSLENLVGEGGESERKSL